MDARKETAVPILENLFGPTIDRYQRSLSRASERHTVLSQNLANANTPGYQRRDVDLDISFDAALGRAHERFDSFSGSASENQTSLRLDGNNVDLEKEVMALAETELRYQAVTDMTAGYFAGLKNVIREGR